MLEGYAAVTADKMIRNRAYEPRQPEACLQTCISFGREIRRIFGCLKRIPAPVDASTEHFIYKGDVDKKATQIYNALMDEDSDKIIDILSRLDEDSIKLVINKKYQQSDTLLTSATVGATALEEDQKRENLLHFACRTENKKLIQFLLAKGAKMLDVTTEGKSALHLLLEKDKPNSNLIKLMLKAIPDQYLDAKVYGGKSALEVVDEYFNPEARNLLTARGAKEVEIDTEQLAETSQKGASKSKSVSWSNEIKVRTIEIYDV